MTLPSSNTHQSDPFVNELPPEHPFADMVATLAGGDAPCCARPDSILRATGDRYCLSYRGLNATARLRLLIDKIALCKPPLHSLKCHWGGDNAYMVVYLMEVRQPSQLSLMEHSITVAPKPSNYSVSQAREDDWEPEHYTPMHPIIEVDKPTKVGGCVMMPSY